MSSVGAALVSLLRTVDRPGDFCIGGQREIVMPAVDVEGVGRISFPLQPTQVAELVQVAEQAPYGRGEETLVDRDVRRTWQIDADAVRIGGRRWQQTLDALVADVALGLGVNGSISADFYKLLVYDADSFFVDHRDTEKVPGMFATMVLVLPSVHRGGELVVRHLDREVVFDHHPEEPSEIGFAAFYADCVHAVRPVIAGSRVTLIYNLRFLDRKRLPKPPDHRAEQKRIVDLLRRWADTSEEPDKLILPLEHAYTPAELSFERLKGRDAAVASVLVGATAQAACDLHLALVSIEESGSATYGGGYRRRRWGRDDDEDFEVEEVIDRALTLSHMRRPDGGAPNLAGVPFSEEELCPPDAFEDLTPNDQHFHEATGNEGASFERSYVRAGLVLWPRVRRLAVLNQAGLAATLPHLEELAARWQASRAGIDSPLWQEADELAGHMLRTWRSWRTDDDTNARRMLEALVRLGADARIDEFLVSRPVVGDYAASDNEAIVRAVALLTPSRATKVLIQIVQRNMAARPGACCDLLKRCATAPDGQCGDLTKIAAALIDVLPGARAGQADPLTWRRPDPLTADLVDDLLTATSLIDSRLGHRAVDHILAWPEAYELDSVLVPAAVALTQRPQCRAWPPVQRVREICLAHLRKRIALELEAPRDWARADPIECQCAECRALGAFLIDPERRQWLLKAAQKRRTHVETSVGSSRCDVDLATVRRSTPHTLVATKNQASYEQRLAQRQADLEHEAALAI